jgi:cytochrome c oxidase subunit II
MKINKFSLCFSNDASSGPLVSSDSRPAAASDRFDRAPVVLAILVVIAVALSHYPARATFAQDAPPSTRVGNDTREIMMTAKNYQYDPGVITVKEGEHVKLNVTALDHDHGIKIDAFHIDQVLKKGEPTTVEFTADSSGTFEFQCSRFCGLGHKGMKGELIVEPISQSAVPKNPLKPAEARAAAWRRLREGLNNKDADHRIQAVYALGTLGVQSGTVVPVESELEDKDSSVRQAAAKTLGDMQAFQSIPSLQAALDDQSAAVSFAAAQALWRMGDKSGTNILVQVLGGERSVSSGLIQTQSHDMHEKLHDPTSLTEFGATTAAGAFFPGAGFGVAAVKVLASDKNAGARAVSAGLLSSGTDSDDRAILEQALNDKNWAVRAAAADALGHAGDMSDVNKLMPMLDNSHPTVKYRAAAALVRLTAPSAFWQLRPPVYQRDARKIEMWNEESDTLLEQINNEIANAAMSNGSVLDSLQLAAIEPPQS